MQKRGWIQIVEASISMLILFGLVLGLFQQNIETPDFASQVYKIQHQILTEASDDYCIRNEVLANNTESLNKFIASRLCSLPYNFTTALCSPTEACLFPERVEKPKTDIYSNNMIIAANLTSYNPVKIAFFVWQGSTQCETYECVKPTGAVCGDGILQSGEECDDSNLVSGDGCSSICRTEAPCTPVIFYQDADSDGYGSPSVTTSACTQPAGYVSDKTDCNDANAAVHPGATESSSVSNTCNDGLDNDCNGGTDYSGTPNDCKCRSITGCKP